MKLKEFDRQVGALFGFAKGVLLCVLITLFAVTLLSEPQRQAICNSKSGYYIAILLDKADAVIPGEVHEVLDPYIDRLDREIDHPHTEGVGFKLPGGDELTMPKLPSLDGIIEAKPAGGMFDPQMADRPGSTRRPTARRRPETLVIAIAWQGDDAHSCFSTAAAGRYCRATIAAKRLPTWRQA